MVILVDHTTTYSLILHLEGGVPGPGVPLVLPELPPAGPGRFVPMEYILLSREDEGHRLPLAAGSPPFTASGENASTYTFPTSFERCLSLDLLLFLGHGYISFHELGIILLIAPLLRGGAYAVCSLQLITSYDSSRSWVLIGHTRTEYHSGATRFPGRPAFFTKVKFFVGVLDRNCTAYSYSSSSQRIVRVG